MAVAKSKRQNRKVRPTIETIPAPNAEHSKFARALGSADPLTRNKAVEALVKWLTIRTNIKESEMIRIWKGLFYCFWHSDLPPVQAELAEQLSAILESLSLETGLSYFTTFFQTMRREWFGIDRLRLDKFLMLIRKLMVHLFKYLQEEEWCRTAVEKYTSFLQNFVLMPNDSHLAAGVSYHVADIYVTELFDVATEVLTIPSTAFGMLMDPMCNVILQTTQPALMLRVKEGVFGNLLERIRNADEELPVGEDDLKALADKLFELGAKPEVHVRNRESAYEISNAMEKALKKRARWEAHTDDNAHAASTKVDTVSRAQRSSGPPSSSSPDSTGQQEEEGSVEPMDGADKKKKRKRVKEKSTADIGPAPDVSQDGELLPPHSLPEPQPAGGDKKKKKKKKSKQREAASAQAAPSSQVSAPATVCLTGHTGNGVAPLQQSNGVEIDDGTVDVIGEAAPKKKLGKQKALRQRKENGVPSVQSTQHNGVKSVHWGLDHNLYLTMGEPVPPKDVRTPPRAQPKGSALKSTRYRVPTPAIKLGLKKSTDTGRKTSARVSRLLSAGY